MASGVFGLNKVYKKQYKNIKSNNFASWPESATYGYYLGGNSPDFLKRLDFSNETINTNSSISWYPKGSGTQSSLYGYFGGGETPTPGTSATIKRFDFSNETQSFPGNDLNVGRRKAATVSNSSYGYFGGGYFYNYPQPSNYYRSDIQRLDFSNETLSNPGNNLPSTRSSMGSVLTSSYGYFGGGNEPSIVSLISRLDFSNETLSNPGNNLPPIGSWVGRSNASGLSSPVYGYFCGGNVGGGVHEYVSKINFSNETISNPGPGTLPGSAGSQTATQNSINGYLGGGNANPGATYNTVLKLDFLTETGSLPGTNFPAGFSNAAGVSGGASVYRGAKTYGYFGGGYSPPFINTISRLDFSTEGFSNPGKNLTTAIGWTAAISSNYYGYFGGGHPGFSCTITRLDFSNEIISNPGKNFPAGRFNFAAVSSNSYGYFGGSSPAYLSTVTRLDFSTENVSNPGKNLPSTIGNFAAVSSNSYGYFGGGNNPSGGYVCTITRIDFTNETLSNPGKNLPVARENLTAVSNSFYGYFGGGYAPPFINTIERLDFSTENVSNPGKNLPVGVSRLGGTSSMFFGYFAGGQTSPTVRTNAVSKIDFSTENISVSPSLPSVRNILTGLSNSN